MPCTVDWRKKLVSALTWKLVSALTWKLVSTLTWTLVSALTWWICCMDSWFWLMMWLSNFFSDTNIWTKKEKYYRMLQFFFISTSFIPGQDETAQLLEGHQLIYTSTGTVHCPIYMLSISKLLDLFRPRSGWPDSWWRPSSMQTYTSPFCFLQFSA
jgi:hypothetical protein